MIIIDVAMIRSCCHCFCTQPAGPSLLLHYPGRGPPREFSSALLVSAEQKLASSAGVVVPGAGCVVVAVARTCCMHPTLCLPRLLATFLVLDQLNASFVSTCLIQCFSFSSVFMERRTNSHKSSPELQFFLFEASCCF